MTDDLVTRLLDIAGDTNEENETLHEAADRIEKLTAALRWIVEQERQTAHPTVCAIVKTARKALDAE